MANNGTSLTGIRTNENHPQRAMHKNITPTITKQLKAQCTVLKHPPRAV